MGKRPRSYIRTCEMLKYEIGEELFCKKNYVMTDDTIAFSKGRIYNIIDIEDKPLNGYYYILINDDEIQHSLNNSVLNKYFTRKFDKEPEVTLEKFNIFNITEGNEILCIKNYYGKITDIKYKDKRRFTKGKYYKVIYVNETSIGVKNDCGIFHQLFKRILKEYFKIDDDPEVTLEKNI